MGDILVYDISNATLVNKLTRRENGAIYSMDISQEDSILAVGYENHKVELIDLPKAKTEIEEFAGGDPSTGKYILSGYKTKQSLIMVLKFTFENLLLAVSVFTPEPTSTSSK